MWLEKLRLVNFRNYQDQIIEFKPGVNLITGSNGIGKTNIVESINYLSFGKSFRTTDDKEVINFNSKFARIESSLLIKQKKKTLNLLITSNGKKVEYDGSELKKLSDLSGVVYNVSFVPEDVNLFKVIPGIRRKFLDSNLVSLSKDYLFYISEYRNLLKERNAMLKSDDIDMTYLEVINDKMIKPQFKIIKYRYKFARLINNYLQKVFDYLDTSQRELKVKYQSVAPENITYEDYHEKMMTLYKNEIEGDKRRKATSVGIHHDDIQMFLDNRLIGVYGSQGQNRLAVLALKLSLYKVIKDEKDDDPIVILDDVLSELDQKHQIRLLSMMMKFEQVFITCAKESLIINKCTSYAVSEHGVMRRN